MALKLNPLAVSKGKKFLCEMCGKAATLSCQYCRVTFYCDKEHQSIDWFGIHEKVCQLLGALRTLRPTLGSEDERQRRNLTVQMSQHALIDLCKNEAQKHLVQGQYELAIPGALQSLRFSMEVYGSGRIELVPAYLLLAEANLGLKRYKVAEEFLLYANWSVLKNPDCSSELKSQLHRNFGKLYASQGRYDDSLRQLANDVYYSSLESGPEHIDTAGGYFYMADVFLSRGVIEHALAYYDKVVDIWYKFLINLRHRPEESITDYLSEAHIGEAVEMLRSVLETRKKYLGSSHIATGEAAYALGILKHITAFEEEARSHYKQALIIYESQLGADNESTLAILRALGDLPPVGDEQAQEDMTGTGNVTATLASIMGGAATPVPSASIPEAAEEEEAAVEAAEPEAAEPEAAEPEAAEEEEVAVAAEPEAAEKEEAVAEVAEPEAAEKEEEAAEPEAAEEKVAEPEAAEEEAAATEPEAAEVAAVEAAEPEAAEKEEAAAEPEAAEEAAVETAVEAAEPEAAKEEEAAVEAAEPEAAEEKAAAAEPEAAKEEEAAVEAAAEPEAAEKEEAVAEPEAAEKEEAAAEPKAAEEVAVEAAEPEAVEKEEAAAEPEAAEEKAEPEAAEEKVAEPEAAEEKKPAEDPPAE